MDKLLHTINSPEDVKLLDNKQLTALCGEIREQLIDVVSETGGHLASNLGTVELTVAMHKVFDCPQDTFVFDVGHQCYTHKLLTGRQGRFRTLRKKDGLSGFPKPEESEYDSFIEGHASTSLSQAVGIAQAKLLRGDSSYTVAVIGDGSFGGGMAYEAINNMDSSLRRLIVVLNDNSMSISKSVGTISKYFMQLRTSGGYVRFKERIKWVLDRIPLIGRPLKEALARAKASFRRKLFGGTFFEELGFNYVGPIDGHDLQELCSIFSRLKEIKDGPVFLHVITQKGKGYALAEDNPGAYHGVGRFDVEQGNPDISLADSFSNTVGRKLAELARADRRLCAVTAAMKYGTGLQYFYRSCRNRFFDVGIAEQHAVTMSAGLARGGMKPVFCVYSSFLQRAYDQLIHDVALGSMDVMLGIDRAGLVGDDGETHQGIYDAAFLSAIPGFTIAAP
ncbi:MAG: 1-deoxy-D-xylulose-5-phosphate synthase, partial [Oscillospiraceae bacterium]|nr:1-deoxy-D-xylulose-5-phosphate synthase [Oscillospiraceae bacterium]